MKKIVVVNAGPRKGWNTDTLLKEAAAGCESAGAEVVWFDLFDLPDFKGCRSCFACKTDKCKGRCIVQDGLAPVLEAIRSADGLIMGSPNYLGNLTSSFRALYERLVFQSLTYNAETPCCNDRLIPGLLIMTSNAEDTYYKDLLAEYQATLSRFVGPTEVLVSGDTLQLSDYDATAWPWSFFDPASKIERHETVFPQEKEAAFEKGAALAAE